VRQAKINLQEQGHFDSFNPFDRGAIFKSVGGSSNLNWTSLELLVLNWPHNPVYFAFGEPSAIVTIVPIFTMTSFTWGALADIFS